MLHDFFGSVFVVFRCRGFYAWDVFVYGIASWGIRDMGEMGMEGWMSKHELSSLGCSDLWVFGEDVGKHGGDA